ncbi:MAG: molybdopterin guanine dinucleotide synthesis [Pseudotabrizicola sp.]|uniref:molybdopterin guanine dinucleotide synthesis n=1 Tax=Pseudotabrizicola sp. TaxID=2939647 RepID=UPI0027168320|nr:molybdopterin guanine dinucleotide synthesis [Pseudotabrizicola sp.]MDO9638936.1 molybdopterin guanine dinucleotide synthesis [Pseudotabrizicola sp.]
MRFDRVAILDWSAAKGPKRGKDSIWLAVAAPQGCTAHNIATRPAAEAALTALIADSLAQNHRLLLGADFAFGAPEGFVARLTGQPDALSWWGWLADRVTDTPGNVSNYRQIAAQMNSAFAGDGPFWGNGEKIPTPGLPRLKPVLPPGLATHRATDLVARGPGASPKPIWQLAGAGAVGAQVLTGVPVLERLRQRFTGQVSVWPFEPPTTPIVLAEVYPSLLAAVVRRHVAATGMVADEAQVRLLAAALHRLGPTEMKRLFTLPHPVPEEGWILGAGHAALLQASG